MLKTFSITALKVFAFLFVLYFVPGLLSVWFSDPVFYWINKLVMQFNILHIVVGSLIFSSFFVMLKSR